MGKSDRILLWIFTGILMLFCLFMIWFVPNRLETDFQLADIDLSLETSYGRERKQQYEYDEVTAALPVTRAELEEARPLADAAAAVVSSLKEERKLLRQEKEELLALLETQRPSGPADETSSLPGTSGTEGGGTDE